MIPELIQVVKYYDDSKAYPEEQYLEDFKAESTACRALQKYCQQKVQQVGRGLNTTFHAMNLMMDEFALQAPTCSRSGAFRHMSYCQSLLGRFLESKCHFL